MYIISADLLNFRNHARSGIALTPGVTIFYGNNAQGKTNILEAIYLAGTTRSHKGSKDRDMIRRGEEESHIRMDVIKHGITHRIDVHLKKNKTKGIAIDRIPVKKASELFGVVNMVFFSPEDLDMIKDGPAVRRRFLNYELSQLDKVYLSSLSDYSRCVMQRNKLLRDMEGKKEREIELDVWDAMLVKSGSEIIQLRSSFLKTLNEVIQPIYEKLTGGEEKISLRYEPSTPADSFPVNLAMSRERDMHFCETHVGPHRDDFAILINGTDARIYGSQGQQRSAALALKLAEIEMIKNKTGDTPVLLLDDVLSELDAYRRSQLLSGISNIQTLITCTGLDEFVKQSFDHANIYRVVKGTVISEKRIN